MSLVIGIDFGGVLSTHDHKNNTGSEHINLSVNIQGAMNGLMELKKAGHKLVLISFCGKRRAIETSESINKSVPGLFDHLYFTKKKEYKKHICVHAGVDVFIDDTLSILTDVAMNTTGRHLILFSGDPGFEDQGEISGNIMKISSWPEIVNFCSTIKPASIPVVDEKLNKWAYNLE